MIKITKGPNIYVAKCKNCGSELQFTKDEFQKNDESCAICPICGEEIYIDMCTTLPWENSEFKDLDYITLQKKKPESQPIHPFIYPSIDDFIDKDHSISIKQPNIIYTTKTTNDINCK